jgi:hypothetical protein
MYSNEKMEKTIKSILSLKKLIKLIIFNGLTTHQLISLYR